jgi:hypothetical protein
MAETAGQTGRLLQIGYQHRSNPRYQHVRQRLLGEAELLGRVVYVRGQSYQPIMDDIGWPRRFEMPESELQPFGYADMHQLRNWRSFRSFPPARWPNSAAVHMDAVAWLLDAVPQSVIGGRQPGLLHRRASGTTTSPRWSPTARRRDLQGQFQVLTTTSGDGHRSYQHLMGTEGFVADVRKPSLDRRLPRTACAGLGTVGRIGSAEAAGNQDSADQPKSTSARPAWWFPTACPSFWISRRTNRTWRTSSRRFEAKRI